MITWAGAAFLGWLGVRSIYKVMKYADGGLQVLNTQASPPRAGSFGQGLAVNLLNPAIATFYLVVLPSFIRADAPAWFFAALAAVHILMAFACHAAWALALHRLRRLFTPPAARRILEAATGVALVGLAIRVVLG
jgi:threonine/homoserine/homoserine lactone efflux protein